MATFILVHGSWQGGWCWSEVVPRLRAGAHEALTPDLPAHGDDPTPVNDVTLWDYVDSLVRLLETMPEPAILVGHSMGGLAMQVAEAVPDRVRALVYVSAILPPDGVAMLQVVDGFDPEYLTQLVWAPDGRSAEMRPEGARTFLYPLCPERLVKDALGRFTPEPVAPFEVPLHTTPERLGRVRAYYVECLQDRVVPIDLQRSMQQEVGISRVFSLNCDHSPFFSAPDELVACLRSVADDTAR
jgi:pimeloyl-ACP methyl ester carboxylesterase